MLSNENVSNGDEYANLLIESIRSSHEAYAGDDRMDDEVIDRWCKEIRQTCIKRYVEYIAGDEESYKLSEEDITDLYKKAVMHVTGELLSKLVESGDIQMSVREDGEIAYSATDKGKKRSTKTSKKKK
jgi:hypothetical protein